MKALTTFVLALLWGFQLLAANPPAYESLKTEAEKFYADKSFAKAHELYGRATVMSNITSNEARWVWFRNYDTQWRSHAATETADPTKLDQARAALEKLVRDDKRAEERDRVWVEVQESLGDFHWTRRNQQNWGVAWP